MPAVVSFIKEFLFFCVKALYCSARFAFYLLIAAFALEASQW